MLEIQNMPSFWSTQFWSNVFSSATGWIVVGASIFVAVMLLVAILSLVGEFKKSSKDTAAPREAPPTTKRNPFQVNAGEAVTLILLSGFVITLAGSGLVKTQRDQILTENIATVTNAYGIEFSPSTIKNILGEKPIQVVPEQDSFLTFENVLSRDSGVILDRVVINRDDINHITVLVPAEGNETELVELPLVD